MVKFKDRHVNHGSNDYIGYFEIKVRIKKGSF